MDGRGGCCIARYAGGGENDMSKVNRIMLRFRPIAPKPTSNAGPVTGGFLPEITDVGSRSGRGKRRYNKSSGYNNRKRKALSEEKVDADVVTLPLLPETPERRGSPGREPLGEFLSVSQREGKSAPMWLSFGSGNSNVKDLDRTVLFDGFEAKTDRTVLVVGSCVTVECVTDTWVDEDGLGCTDNERRLNLEIDACPGFVSDGSGKVTWTNGAFREMVMGQGCIGEMVVWLVMKETAVPRNDTLASHRAFTCRVRVQYYHGNTKINNNNNACGSSITVPCDVWRMDGGGFAWRLDVKAALCLGR